MPQSGRVRKERFARLAQKPSELGKEQSSYTAPRSRSNGRNPNSRRGKTLPLFPLSPPFRDLASASPADEDQSLIRVVNSPSCELLPGVDSWHLACSPLAEIELPGHRVPGAGPVEKRRCEIIGRGQLKRHR